MPQLAKTAREENEACEAVIHELRSFLAQNSAPKVSLTMCDEMAGRIAMRRLLTPSPEEPRDE